MLIEDLIQLDFTESEAKILLFLVQNSKTTASKISKETHINRTTTYDILDRLIDKGFISYIVKSIMKCFMTRNLEKLEEHYEKKYEKAKELTSKLSSLKQESKELIEVYEGRKGIRSILKDILNYKEYVAFGSSGKILEVMKHDFIQFQREKQKLKIKSKIIQTNSNKKLQEVAHAKFKIIPSNHESPTTTIIYANKVAILT